MPVRLGRRQGAVVTLLQNPAGWRAALRAAAGSRTGKGCYDSCAVGQGSSCCGPEGRAPTQFRIIPNIDFPLAGQLDCVVPMNPAENSKFERELGERLA